MPAKKYWLLWGREKKWNWLVWFGGESWNKSHRIFVCSAFRDEVVPQWSGPTLLQVGRRLSGRAMHVVSERGGIKLA